MNTETVVAIYRQNADICHKTVQRLVLTARSGMQMYNKQKEIEALEKRQALSKVQQEEEEAQSAAPQRANGAAQQDQLHSNAAANGGLYRATSHRAAPASTPAAPVDPAAEVPCFT